MSKTNIVCFVHKLLQEDTGVSLDKIYSHSEDKWQSIIKEGNWRNQMHVYQTGNTYLLKKEVKDRENFVFHHAELK